MIKKIISVIMAVFLSLLLIGVSLLTVGLGVISLSEFVILFQDFTSYHLSTFIVQFLMLVSLILIITGILVSLKLVYYHYKEEAYTEKFTQGLSVLTQLTLLISGILIVLSLFLFRIIPIDLFDLTVVFGFILVLWILAAVIALVRVIVLDTIEFKDENELVV